MRKVLLATAALAVLSGCVASPRYSGSDTPIRQHSTSGPDSDPTPVAINSQRNPTNDRDSPQTFVWFPLSPSVKERAISLAETAPERNAWSDHGSARPALTDTQRQALARDVHQACVNDNEVTARLRGNTIRYCGCLADEVAQLIKAADEISPNDVNLLAEVLEVAYNRCNTDRSVWNGISPT